MCNSASRGGIAYVTGTADLVEGQRRQRLGMGAVSCRQGQHTQVTALHKVGCGGSDSLLRESEGGMGLLRPRKCLVSSMSVIPTVGVGQGGYDVKALQPYSEAQVVFLVHHGENV